MFSLSRLRFERLSVRLIKIYVKIDYFAFDASTDIYSLKGLDPKSLC